MRSSRFWRPATRTCCGSARQHRVIFNLSHIGKALQSVHVFDLLYRAFIKNTALYEFLNFFKKTLAFFVSLLYNN